MNEELSVKINICGKLYPMKVRVEEESYIRTAGKRINEQIETYKTSFGTENSQDLLAMLSFDLFMQIMRLQETQHKQEEQLTQYIKELLHKLHQAL